MAPITRAQLRALLRFFLILSCSSTDSSSRTYFTSGCVEKLWYGAGEGSVHSRP